MTKKLVTAVAVVVVALSAAVGVQAFATHHKHNVTGARLSGYNETPKAINSPGTGTFTASLDNQAQTLTYTLTYSGLSSQVRQAHIHFGNFFGSGQGVALFLCTNLGNGPAGTPACPGTTSGTVTGTLHPADVQAIADQGLAAGDWNSVVKAIRAGVAYANVHTANWPAGEIRAQLHRIHEDDDD
jgi:hypothetical protein